MKMVLKENKVVVKNVKKKGDEIKKERRGNLKVKERVNG